MSEESLHELPACVTAFESSQIPSQSAAVIFWGCGFTPAPSAQSLTCPMTLVHLLMLSLVGIGLRHDQREKIRHIHRVLQTRLARTNLYLPILTPTLPLSLLLHSLVPFVECCICSLSLFDIDKESGSVCPAIS